MAASPIPTCRIALIQYPSSGFFKPGKGVLLGAYAFGSYAYEWTALSPAERIRQALEFGAQIHPQYQKEFENGISVGWHREPATLGCFAVWSEEARASSTTRISARSTGASCWPASMRPTCRPGRRVRCCPRSTRSRGCTGACVNG